MINKSSLIYVAGHRGMVGSATLRILKSHGYNNVLTIDSKSLDLRNQIEVRKFFNEFKPEYVVCAAAKVGGILDNDSYPYEYLYQNSQIQNNIINESYLNNVKKLIFLGSSCIYPRNSKQPIKEEYLLTSKLEETNKWYAIAKISGVMMINAIRKEYGLDYVSLMPTNLYGDNDNFNLKSSHVLPALIRKFDDAKKNKLDKVILWGSGNPMREFLHVDDLAEAIVLALEKTCSYGLYNVGSGSEISIDELAKLISKVTGFDGIIEWDKSKPDGTPRKLMDSTRFKELGWNSKITLDVGLEKTFQWYKENINTLRK